MDVSRCLISSLGDERDKSVDSVPIGAVKVIKLKFPILLVEIFAPVVLEISRRFRSQILVEF
jgi:hypothetical protein